MTLLLSFEEFEQLPDEPGKAELLDGELLRLPPAKRKHSELVRRIHVLLMHAVDKDTVQLGWVQPILKQATSSAVKCGFSQT